MRLTHLTVKNFGRFEELIVPLHERFTLLIGDNGAGKTSILDALSVASSSFFLGLTDVDPRGIKDKEIRNTPRFYDAGPEWIDNLPVSISCEGIFFDGENIPWELTRSSRNGKTQYKLAAKLKAYAAGMDKALRENTEVLFPLISYYGTGRLWREPNDVQRDEKKKSRYDAYRYSHSPILSSAELLRWMKYQRYSELEKKAALGTFEAWKNAVSTCFLPLKAIPDYSVAHDRAEVTFRDEAKEHIVPYEQLSHGQRTIFCMVGDIAYKALTLNPHLGADAVNETPGVILIDEIDLHLHPKWQRNIIPSLLKAFPKMQFIASTHSPFIIQSLRPEDGFIFNLDRTASGKQPVQNENYNISIEDIAEETQSVENPCRSALHNELIKVSTEYYQKLDKLGKNPKDEEAVKLRQDLDKLMEKAATDPAVAAFLTFRREAADIDN